LSVFPLSADRASSRDQRTASYSIGYHLIYVAISFDKQATHERAHELAGKHRLGLFEASSPDGEIWLPGVGDELVLASKHEHRRQNPEPVTDPRIAALVRSHPPGRWAQCCSGPGDYGRGLAGRTVRGSRAIAAGGRHTVTVSEAPIAPGAVERLRVLCGAVEKPTDNRRGTCCSPGRPEKRTVAERVVVARHWPRSPSPAT